MEEQSAQMGMGTGIGKGVCVFCCYFFSFFVVVLRVWCGRRSWRVYRECWNKVFSQFF